MANTQAMCNSFKREIFNGEHQFGTPTLVSRTSLTAPTVDSFKAALFVVTATKNKSTTVYNTTDEVSGAGYSAGGVAVTNATVPTLDTDTAIWTPSASIVYTSVTLATAFDCMILYNSTQSNKAVAVFTFGSQTVTAGTFTLTMPANTAAAALLRIV